MKSSINNAIIFAGGDISGFNRNDFDLNSNLIICVDRGVEFAIDNDLEIDICIGDFDSIDTKYLDKINSRNILKQTFNKDKDKSDLELALDYCYENNMKNISLFGATGSRLDHTLSNIYLLKKFYDKGVNIQILDKNNTIFYTNKDIILDKINRYISILPTDEKAIFSISGSKWELNDYRLEFGSTHTISNEFIEDIKIQIKKGSIFIILAKD